SRTIVAVMASVGVLAGICAVLGVCGFTMALQVPYVGTPISLASPFTAICVLIDPGNFSSDFHNGPYMHDSSSTDHGSEYFGRALLFFMTLAVSAGYCLLVWWMYKSMVKNFDMIIRRQHQ
ncbi:MAG TPA: hypothetical protein VHM90_01205, partial [Phycisphaerae bacterium]|nr:hypothetical protein [Phycisphaerae bacterium]